MISEELCLDVLLLDAMRSQFREKMDRIADLINFVLNSDAYEHYVNYCWGAFCHVLECDRYFGYYQPWGIRYKKGEYILWEEDQFKYQCDCGCECYIVLTRVPRSKNFSRVCVV